MGSLKKTHLIRKIIKGLSCLSLLIAIFIPVLTSAKQAYIEPRDISLEKIFI